MPPLLRTYFNPSHRSFLQTLFATTFLAGLTIAAFPCPVTRNTNGGVRNDDGEDYVDGKGTSSRSGGEDKGRGTVLRREGRIVEMMNSRGKGRKFMDED